MADYYAIISQIDGGFVIFFPDLPGCDVYALTMPDAVAEAGKVLGDHLAELQRLGRPAPEPSSLETIRGDPDNADGLAVLIRTANGRIMKGRNLH
jgi:predicted RNase H-like HicB family nuclease